MHSLLFDMLRVVQVYLHDIKMQDASFEWDTLKNTLWAIHSPSNKTLCQMVQLSFFISFLKYKTYTNETIDDKKITLERHCGKNWVQKTSFLDIHRQYYFIMCPFFWIDFFASHTSELWMQNLIIILFLLPLFLLLLLLLLEYEQVSSVHTHTFHIPAY